MDFKEKLLYTRAILKMTQTELAHELDVSFETINRWENGKFRPSKRAEYAFDIFCKNKGVHFEE